MTPKEVIQRLWSLRIPKETREEYNKKYNLALKPGDIFQDAMIARVRGLAKESPEWAEIAKKTGIGGNEQDSHMDS